MICDGEMAAFPALPKKTITFAGCGWFDTCSRQQDQPMAIP
jgi:hypothetical protein